MSCEETAESIEMPFGMWTEVGPRNQALDGIQIATREGAILRAKTGPPGTCPVVDMLRVTQQGAALVREAVVVGSPSFLRPRVLEESV